MTSNVSVVKCKKKTSCGRGKIGQEKVDETEMLRQQQPLAAGYRANIPLRQLSFEHCAAKAWTKHSAKIASQMLLLVIASAVSSFLFYINEGEEGMTQVARN